MKKKYILTLGTAFILSSFPACTSGKIYTSTGNGGPDSFTYAIPETVVKIDLPVKYWRMGKMEGTEFIPSSTNNVAYLEANATDTAVVTFDFEGHPSPLNVRVLDQLNNTTSLDKFEVKYHSTGTEADPHATAIIKSINSEATDKLAETIKNVTDTAGQVLKLATNAALLVQSAEKDKPVVLLEDHIRVTARLREGYGTINARLKKELARIDKNIIALKDSSTVSIQRGITGIELDGTVSGWPENISRDFITSRLTGGESAATDKVFANRKSTRLINGVIYTDARNSPFTLKVSLTDMNARKETRELKYTAQVPEAGGFRLLPINPKFFGKRNISASFARNGKLLSWGYTSGSRAEKASGFAKDEATSLNTIANDLVTQGTKEATTAATTQAHTAKLDAQIAAKEGELRVAKTTVKQKENALVIAQAAYTNGKDTDKAAALLTALDAAEVALETAKNSVINAQSDIDALLAKRSGVRAGLLTP